MSLNRPFYEGRPIGSIGALARALGVDGSRLRRTATRADRLYEGPIIIARPGRNPRTVFSASPKLRDIQQRILDRVLRRVHFPGYLMGGLEGRSYIENARRHSGARVLFGQDVDAFYPSIPREHIKRIFLDIFHFAPEVASLLARLTSRKGELVQGGVASTHLANLALYRTEPELERQMRNEGLAYSRFVDDVHVSSRTSLSIPARTRVVSSMRACLERHGYRPKRKKQFVVSAGVPMHVHRLNVNNSASVPSDRRQQLRAGDDFEAFIPIGGQKRARERRHLDARKRALRHRLEAQVLVQRAPFRGRDFSSVALEHLGEREPLRGSSIDDDAFVEVGLDAARPLLGVRPGIERFRLRREAGAPYLHSPDLAALLEGRHRTVLLNGVSPGCATGTVPELSQKALKATIQKTTAIQETS